MIFIKIGLKLSYFCQKNKKFSRAGVSAPTPYASGGWGSAPRPPQRPPHCNFLVTGMLEEKFTARYCRHPLILAFDFKYAWNVWRRRCSHSQTVYNTAKSISPGSTYTEKLSQKSFHLHQPHFGFGRDEVFFFLNIVRSSNKFYRAKQRNLIFVQNCRVKTRFCLWKFWVPPPLKPHKLIPKKSIFMIAPLLEHPKLNVTKNKYRVSQK